MELPNPRPLLRPVSLRTFSRMRRRALSPHLWCRLEPNWTAGRKWPYLETPTVETERQIRQKFDARDNRNLVDRFAKSHERAAHTPRWRAAQAELASLRGRQHPTYDLHVRGFLASGIWKEAPFAHVYWRLMSIWPCGVISMAECGVASSSLTFDLFHLDLKFVVRHQKLLFALSLCAQHVCTCCSCAWQVCPSICPLAIWLMLGRRSPVCRVLGRCTPVGYVGTSVSLIGRCLLLTVATSSWVEEFIARYQAQGLGMVDDLEEDWARRTREYGVRRPTQVGRVFVYRAFDLWSQTGPFYRATVATHQMMIPDELLWRIAPDLGNNWNQVGWRLVPVDDSRSASCLTDLIYPTYVLIMPGLLGDMSHRPHGLLEVTNGDTCHVRATVLPPRINLPILQELLHAFCRRGWPMVRCSGTHNRVALTDELQDCSHGFFVQITVTGVIPAHALDISRWCQHAGRLLHLGPS